MDLGTKDVVKHQVGKYDHVSTYFKRQALTAIPEELFDLRLACLQNLTLVSLKFAKASKGTSDFEATIERANAALEMDGHAAKALMRKGTAQLGLGKISEAAQVLTLAAQKTKGKDPEVMRLLELILEAKGKGKGKGKLRGKGAGTSGPSSGVEPTIPGVEDDPNNASVPYCGSCCSYSSDSEPELPPCVPRAGTVFHGSLPAKQKEPEESDDEDVQGEQAKARAVDNVEETHLHEAEVESAKLRQASADQSSMTERSPCASARTVAIVATVLFIVVGNTLMLRRSNLFATGGNTEL